MVCVISGRVTTIDATCIIHTQNSIYTSRVRHKNIFPRSRKRKFLAFLNEINLYVKLLKNICACIKVYTDISLVVRIKNQLTTIRISHEQCQYSWSYTASCWNVVINMGEQSDLQFPTTCGNELLAVARISTCTEDTEKGKELRRSPLNSVPFPVLRFDKIYVRESCMVLIHRTEYVLRTIFTIKRLFSFDILALITRIYLSKAFIQQYPFYRLHK